MKEEPSWSWSSAVFVGAVALVVWVFLHYAGRDPIDRTPLPGFESSETWHEHGSMR